MVDAAKMNEAMEFAIIESVDKLKGAASLLDLHEDKADSKRITASELAAVRCVIESCFESLDASLQSA